MVGGRGAEKETDGAVVRAVRELLRLEEKGVAEQPFTVPQIRARLPDAHKSMAPKLVRASLKRLAHRTLADYALAVDLEKKPGERSYQVRAKEAILVTVEAETEAGARLAADDIWPSLRDRDLPLILEIRPSLSSPGALARQPSGLGEPEEFSAEFDDGEPAVRRRHKR